MKKLHAIVVPTLLLISSGCSSYTTKLENQTMRQSTQIQRQQFEIDRLAQKNERYAREIKVLKQQLSTIPSEEKKDPRLKKVEDTNYNSNYMYPQTKKVTRKTRKTVDTKLGMTKEACIQMVGEEKFHKYTTMFGTETATIKRCSMIKALNN